MSKSLEGIYRYHKLEKIGEGTFGVVYKAKDKLTQNIVALKRIRLEDEDDGVPATAIREVSLLRELDHPNVIKIQNVILENGKLHFVLDYVKQDLKCYLNYEKKPLPSQTVKSFMRQILSGLAHCHENRVIHRDLKPSNILIDQLGSLKLCDFGLARTVYIPNRTMTAEVCTLWYRPPEILLGQRLYDTSIDIWSVGCIFAELIESCVLFPGDSEIDQLFRIFREKGTPVENEWPGVTKLPNYNKTFPSWSSKPISLKSTNDEVTLDLLNKLLEYEPKKRPTAKEALEHPYFKTNVVNIDTNMDCSN